MQTACEYSELKIPADLSYAPVAEAYIDSVSSHVGFDESEQSKLRAAVNEVFRAIIKSAFEPGERQSVNISCGRVPGGLEIILKDQGAPFEAEELIFGKTVVIADSMSGENAATMRDLVDEVAVNNLGPEGMEIHLIKYLKDQNLDDYLAACQPERFHPPSPRPEMLKKIEFEVRFMKPSEAVEVAKIVYRAYGYSYFYEHAYYPERIADLNANGQMISAVALTSDGEIAGHSAIFNSVASGVAEIGLAVVRPEFRGHGCLLKLADFLLNQGRSKGLKGLYVGAVTSHTFSQQVADRLGFNACGILLGYVASSVSFKEITEKLSQRETFVIAHRYLEKPSRLRIYAPPQHWSFIAKLYESLGANAEAAAPADPLQTSLAEESVFKIKSSVFIPGGVVVIEIVRYGKNIVSEIKNLLKQLCLKRYDLILMYLNMSDSGTFYLTEEFEKLGFFFSGILPRASDGEALVLQYLNNVPMDYERIKLHSRMGREILDYIKQKDPNRG
jgi:anti-sigma regulatory factor (Ser/Thr protein kinase)/N-acetylglutamate synthase-like GNAT family acetyltransferase